MNPRYGVDAPAVPAVLAGTGVACSLLAAKRRRARIPMAAAGAVLIANAGVYLHTTLHGKLRVWERELDRIGLKGHEQLLDLGCGRGMVLIAAAKRLPAGRAIGVDLWTADQSGNTLSATLANAASAGVTDRVEVHTADVTALPFANDSFDTSQARSRSTTFGQQKGGTERSTRPCACCAPGDSCSSPTPGRSPESTATTSARACCAR